MSSNTPLTIRVMTEADISVGMKLKALAGWNQTQADWERFLSLDPSGCFLAEVEGQGVGTATAFRFGAIAWIAMVLVDPDIRGRGIGTALMRHTLDWLDGHGIESVRLDATHLGRPIYEKLGFVAQFELARFEGEPTPSPHPGADGIRVESATSEDQPALFDLDRRVMKTDRANLLRRLFQEAGQQTRVVRDGSGIRGFLVHREGFHAAQVGPCIADAGAGAALLDDAWRRFAGRRVFADVPVDHGQAVAAVHAAGLAEQRRFVRMTRGRMITEDLTPLWLSSGPEKG